MKIFLRIIKWMLISVIALIVCAGLWMKWIVDTNTKVNKSNEKVISLKSNSDKKALIIYQPSRTNVTSKAANVVGDTLKNLGYEVTINYPSGKLNYDISQYQVLVFGTPIYVGNHSSVLEEYMKSIKDYSGKKVLVFATGGNREDINALDYLQGIVKGAAKIEKVKLINGDTNTAIDMVKALIKE